jgi:3-hydroxypropionate dehydrogenase (NADP+)
MLECLPKIGDSVKIKNVACIGTGVIGEDWALLFSLKRLNVTLHDSDRIRLNRLLGNIERRLLFLKQNGFIEGKEIKGALKRLTVHDSIDQAVRDADYVQESVYENYASKKQVFGEIEKHARRRALIASSTSALSLSEIQKGMRAPGRCIIVHPMTPVYLMPLVELVPSPKTTKTTTTMAQRFMSRLGKVSVVCKKEVPGFVVNRLQSAIYREAINLVNRGVATVEEIDKVIMRGPALRWTFMGPFLVMHMAGGEGGIEHWMNHLAGSYKLRWDDMATWSSIPKEAKRKVAEGIRGYRFLRQYQYVDLLRWRDEKLLKQLNAL